MRAALAIIMATLTLGLVPRPMLAQTGGDWLYSIRMFDALTGWAKVAQGSSGVGARGAVASVVRTTDGGIHWRDVTPHAPPEREIWRHGYTVGWITSVSAWVLAAPAPLPPDTPQGDARSVLFHTVDGGETWKSVFNSFPGEMDFINARDGWSIARNGDVYRSTDGGETWVKIGSAKFPGRKVSMTFLNATTGWITGSSDARDGIYLLVTRNGGHTWQQQRLSLPPQVTPSSSFRPAPYRFFTPRDGILSQADVSYVVFYVTHDGGTTWTPTTPVTFSQGYYRGGSFADVNHGWVTEGDTLYVTSNGGRQWTTVRPGSPFTYVGELDFISPQIGWAVGQALFPPFLLKTVDGGHTWAPMNYTVSRQ